MGSFFIAAIAVLSLVARVLSAPATDTTGDVCRPSTVYVTVPTLENINISEYYIATATETSYSTILLTTTFTSSLPSNAITSTAAVSGGSSVSSTNFVTVTTTHYVTVSLMGPVTSATTKTSSKSPPVAFIEISSTFLRSTSPTNLPVTGGVSYVVVTSLVTVSPIPAPSGSEFVAEATNVSYMKSSTHFITAITITNNPKASKATTMTFDTAVTAPTLPSQAVEVIGSRKFTSTALMEGYGATKKQDSLANTTTLSILPGFSSSSRRTVIPEITLTFSTEQVPRIPSQSQYVTMTFQTYTSLLAAITNTVSPSMSESRDMSTLEEVSVATNRLTSAFNTALVQPYTRTISSSTRRNMTNLVPETTFSSSTTTANAQESSSSFFSSPLPKSRATVGSNTVSSETLSSHPPYPTSSMCGEYGDFTLNFDDMPKLATGNESSTTIKPPPVFNPYHQMFFSEGFDVVPPPTDPYLPSSGSQLLEFVPSILVNGSDPRAEIDNDDINYTGEISIAYTVALGCFSFNAYGASLGCDSRGPDCDFEVVGVRYNPITEEQHQVASELMVVSACPSLTNCSLTHVSLDNAFRNITALQITATAARQPKIWWMDDLRLGWFDNSCSAGLCRQSHI